MFSTLLTTRHTPKKYQVHLNHVILSAEILHHCVTFNISIRCVVRPSLFGNWIHGSTRQRFQGSLLIWFTSTVCHSYKKMFHYLLTLRVWRLEFLRLPWYSFSWASSSLDLSGWPALSLMMKKTPAFRRCLVCHRVRMEGVVVVLIVTVLRLVLRGFTS